MRRLPVYILIDTSTSMRGEPIEVVTDGLTSLVDSLNQAPYALETVCLSIISYNSSAEQIVPLTEVYRLRLPGLTAKGRSALGDALLLLSEKVDTKVRTNTAETKGNGKPLMFLLSDGGYSGPIARPIAEFKKRHFGVVVACAAGEKSHIDVLRKITDNVIKISTTDTASIKSYFRWVSSSISTSSTKVEDMGHDIGNINELPPLPQEIMALHSTENN